MAEADPVLDRLIAWAERHGGVRALIVTSSRANPDARRDAMSDHDIVLAVADAAAFIDDDAWLGAYGTPLVCFNQNPRPDMRLVVYEDGTKIDYHVMPAEALRRIVALPELPAEFDIGYRVVLDKDGLTVGMQPPTYRAHIPPVPTEQQYLDVIEEFWWESTYVAKNLWRNELIQAKYNLEFVMKIRLLVKMLEWRVEIDHGWSVRPGALGRHLRERLSPELWAEFERTYASADIEENWAALDATLALMRRVGTEAGEALGYRYPEELDRKVSAYLASIRAKPHGDAN